jgi:putative Holliday junction resolvase
VTLSKRFLGIDFGAKRIGIAVSDPLNIIARGVTVISHSPAAVEEIRKLAEEFDVQAIVIGLPLNLKGEKARKAGEVEEFAELLRKSINIEIHFWDERFTSHTAHTTLLTMGVKKQQRQSKKRIDEMASALILQGFLDRRARLNT